MTNANDPLSPAARKVADAFWRTCLGEPQTFENDMKALAAALREVVSVYGTSREGEWLVSASDLLSIAYELHPDDH